MRNKNSLVAGLAAALVSISSAGAFASPPPLDTKEGRLGIIQENVAAAMERVRIGVDVHRLSPAEARQLDHRLMAIRHEAGRDGKGMTLAEYRDFLGRIDAISATVPVKPGIG